MSKFCGLYIILGLLCLPIHKISAQDDSDPITKQYWLDYNLKKKISEKVKINSSFGFRSISPHTWNRYWVRPSVNYRRPKRMLKKWNYTEQFIGGLDVFYTQNLNVTDVLELTPYQVYSITIPNRTRLTLQHKFRLDERFELYTNDWSSNFGLRLSYEAILTLRFSGEIWKKGKGLFIPISAKFFYNIKETVQFNDKVRITPGIGYDFSETWSSAFLIGYNYSKTGENDAFKNNDMFFRFRVYHKL